MSLLFQPITVQNLYDYSLNSPRSTNTSRKTATLLVILYVITITLTTSLPFERQLTLKQILYLRSLDLSRLDTIDLEVQKYSKAKRKINELTSLPLVYILLRVYFVQFKIYQIKRIIRQLYNLRNIISFSRKSTILTQYIGNLNYDLSRRISQRTLNL